MAKSFADRYRAEARLIILRALAEEPAGTLSAKLIDAHLQAFAVNRPIEWIVDELKWLETMGAVALTATADKPIARILERGRQHLAHRIRIEGVDRPSEPIE